MLSIICTSTTTLCKNTEIKTESLVFPSVCIVIVHSSPNQIRVFRIITIFILFKNSLDFVSSKLSDTSYSCGNGCDSGFGEVTRSDGPFSVRLSFSSCGYMMIDSRV